MSGKFSTWQTVVRFLWKRSSTGILSVMYSSWGCTNSGQCLHVVFIMPWCLPSPAGMSCVTRQGGPPGHRRATPGPRWRTGSGDSSGTWACPVPSNPRSIWPGDIVMMIIRGQCDHAQDVRGGLGPGGGHPLHLSQLQRYPHLREIWARGRAI